MLCPVLRLYKQTRTYCKNIWTPQCNGQFKLLLGLISVGPGGQNYMDLSDMPVDNKQQQTMMWQQNQYMADSGIHSGATTQVLFFLLWIWVSSVSGHLHRYCFFSLRIVPTRQQPYRYHFLSYHALGTTLQMSFFHVIRGIRIIIIFPLTAKVPTLDDFATTSTQTLIISVAALQVQFSLP